MAYGRNRGDEASVGDVRVTASSSATASLPRRTGSYYRGRFAGAAKTYATCGGPSSGGKTPPVPDVTFHGRRVTPTSPSSGGLARRKTKGTYVTVDGLTSTNDRPIVGQLSRVERDTVVSKRRNGRERPAVVVVPVGGDAARATLPARLCRHTALPYTDTSDLTDATPTAPAVRVTALVDGLTPRTLAARLGHVARLRTKTVVGVVAAPRRPVVGHHSPSPQV